MVVGCDPGLGGAFAVLDTAGSLVHVEDMPVFERRTSGKTRRHVNVHDVGDIISRYPGVVVIEQVGPMPRDGSMQAFQFGFSAGAVHGAAGGLGRRIETVTPQVWKMHFKLSADKEQARQMAVRRWPDMAEFFKRKLDAGRAEAALIALYFHETGWC